VKQFGRKVVAVVLAEAFPLAVSHNRIAERTMRARPFPGWAICHIDFSGSGGPVASALGNGGRSSRVVDLAEVEVVMAGSQCALWAEVEGMNFPLTLGIRWV